MLNMPICQANAEVFQSIKVNYLLKIPKQKLNNGNQLNDNKFGSFKPSEESVFIILVVIIVN